MTTVNIKIEIDVSSLNLTEQETRQRLEKSLAAGVQDVLDFTENVQIKKYTESDHPPRLKYQRTFRLRNASQTEVTSKKLPEIRGEWTVDLGQAPYADEVIGPRSEQKAIHRGRWLSQEDIEKEVVDHADRIVGERLEKDGLL